MSIIPLFILFGFLTVLSSDCVMGNEFCIPGSGISGVPSLECIQLYHEDKVTFYKDPISDFPPYEGEVEILDYKESQGTLVIVGAVWVEVKQGTRDELLVMMATEAAKHGADTIYLYGDEPETREEIFHWRAIVTRHAKVYQKASLKSVPPFVENLRCLYSLRDRQDDSHRRWIYASKGGDFGCHLLEASRFEQASDRGQVGGSSQYGIPLSGERRRVPTIRHEQSGLWSRVFLSQDPRLVGG